MKTYVYELKRTTGPVRTSSRVMFLERNRVRADLKARELANRGEEIRFIRTLPKTVLEDAPDHTEGLSHDA